jgi:hypothetical protein
MPDFMWKQRQEMPLWAFLLGSGQHHGGGGRRRGSPAKQHRRESREAERQVKAELVADDTKSTAEEEVIVEENNITEEKSEKDEIEFKLELDAHLKCKGYDVVEAIEENYQGTLNDLKIDEQDLSRLILIQKLEEEPFEKDDEDENETRRIRFVYKVIVNNNEVAKTLIESWKFRNKFDDLAFRHTVYDKVQIRIQKVQKIWWAFFSSSTFPAVSSGISWRHGQHWHKMDETSHLETRNLACFKLFF